MRFCLCACTSVYERAGGCVQFKKNSFDHLLSGVGIVAFTCIQLCSLPRTSSDLKENILIIMSAT